MKLNNSEFDQYQSRKNSIQRMIGATQIFVHNARNSIYRSDRMNEWASALIFGVALVAFVLGFSSIVMGFLADSEGESVMQQRIEYGFFGVSGIVVCVLMAYALG